MVRSGNLFERFPVSRRTELVTTGFPDDVKQTASGDFLGFHSRKLHRVYGIDSIILSQYGVQE